MRRRDSYVWSRIAFNLPTNVARLPRRRRNRSPRAFQTESAPWHDRLPGSRRFGPSRTTGPEACARLVEIWSNGPGTPGPRIRLPATPNDVNDGADVRDDPCLDASECAHAERTYRRHGTPSREYFLTRSRHSGTRDEPTTHHRPAGVARRPHDIGSADGTPVPHGLPDPHRTRREASARGGAAHDGETATSSVTPRYRRSEPRSARAGLRPPWSRT